MLSRETPIGSIVFTRHGYTAKLIAVWGEYAWIVYTAKQPNHPDEILTTEPISEFRYNLSATAARETAIVDAQHTETMARHFRQ